MIWIRTSNWMIDSCPPEISCCPNLMNNYSVGQYLIHENENLITAHAFKILLLFFFTNWSEARQFYLYSHFLKTVCLKGLYIASWQHPLSLDPHIHWGNTPKKTLLTGEKQEKPQGEQQRRDLSPRMGRRAIDVVYRQFITWNMGKHANG